MAKKILKMLSLRRIPQRRSLRNTGLGLFLAVAVSLGLTLALWQPAHAATSSNLNFQARLQTAAGSIVADGNYNVEFKLYSVATGGSALWTEAWYDSNGVTAGNDNRLTVKNGYLTVNLGAQTAFPGTINWDQDLWITLNVGGTAQTATPTYDGEMNPRLKLTAVPYAFKAGDSATLGGIAASGFIQNTATLQTAANFAIQSAATGSIAALIQGTSGQTANIFQVKANGVSTPLLGVSNTGAIALQQTALSTTAFNIKNSLGNNVFTVDTTNSRIGFNLSGNNLPTLAAPSGTAVGIESRGALHLTTAGTDGYVYYITPLGSNAVRARLSIDTEPVPGFDAVLALGLDSSSASTARGILVADARSVTHQPTISTLSPDESQIFGFGYDGTSTVGVLKNTASTITLQAGSVSNVLTAIGSGGIASVGIGTAGPSYNLDVVGDINTSTKYRVGGSAGASTTCSGGNILQNAVVVGGIVTGGTCAADAGVTTVGTISGSSIANGASISGNTITFGPADGTNPGLVTTGTQTFAGAKTFNGVINANDRLVLAGTLATASAARSAIGGTFNSSSLSSQYGLQNNLNFSPTGASLTNIYGIASDTVISGSSLNLTKYAGITTSLNTTSGYTGLISAGVGVDIAGPTIGGSQLITDYRGISIGGNTANTGNTSGTINNYQLRLNGNTTGAGTGGTLNNYGNYISLSSGTGGTTSNYGLYLTGSGGAGSTNYSIYNASSAANYFLGSLGLNNANPNYPLDVTGDINTTTQYRINGTAGASTTCSGGNFLQNAVIAGGIVTGGTCVAGGSGVTSVGAISGTANANGATVTGSVLNLTAADGTNGGVVTSGTQTFGGAKTFNGTLTANDRLLLAGTLTTTGSARSSITGTLSSSVTSTQYGLQNSLNFSPTGASLTNVYGITTDTTLTGSALNLTKYAGLSAAISTAAGYTGLISAGVGVDIGAPTIGGSQLITDYRGLSVGGNAANGGNTTGTINNYQLRFNGNTAGAGTGGTLNNYGVYATLGSGTGGTTSNYGLYLTGSGGAGSTNYSIYNTSSAANYFQGTLTLGTTSNPSNYQLNIAGDANLTTGSVYRLNGVAGASTTCSGGNFLQNAVIAGGIVTGGTCAAATSGVTSVGAISGTSNANGATVTGNVLNLTAADATNGGVVTNTTQTFAGAKTFNGAGLFKNSTDSVAAFQVQSAGGSALFNVDTTNSIVSVGSSASLKLSALGSCASLNTDASGTVGCGGSIVTIVKPATESVTSSTTLQSDDDLKFNVGANESWSFDFTVDVSAAVATTGFKYSLNIPSGSTYCYFVGSEIENGSTQGSTTCTDAGAMTIQTSYASWHEVIHIRGAIINGATAGVVQLRWAQGASNATATQVRQGSAIKAFRAYGADVAEMYYSKDASVRPGDVVRLDSSIKAGVQKVAIAYADDALGVISTDPGIVLGDGTIPAGAPVLVGLVGRVPVKVSTINGAIKAGDYLTPSDIPGVAMKATKAGAIIGTAMDDYSSDVTGLIQVFLKSGSGTGVGIADMVGNVSGSGDLGLDALAYFGQQDAADTLGVSEVVTDRIAAATEVITPLLTANGVRADTISSATGRGLSMKLGDGESFSLQGSDAKTAIQFDALGNATFSGTVTADKLAVNQIQDLDVLVGQAVTSATDKTSLVSGNLQAQVDGLRLAIGSLADRVITQSLQATSLSLAGNATVAGNLSVAGRATVASLSLQGHLITGGAAPQLELLPYAGATNANDVPGLPMPHLASATLTGNDTGGKLSLTIGDLPQGVQPGDLIKVKFDATYDAVPQVLISARGKVGAQMQFYVSNIQSDYFTIAALGTPNTGETYALSYYTFQ